MTTARFRPSTLFCVAVAFVFAGTALLRLNAQADPTELRERLRERYDVVALQRGIALVPRSPADDIRMIQIVDGVVTIDGEALTGRQLADRLGADAALVLQASYLDASAQRQLAETSDQAPAAETAGARSVRRGDLVRIGGPITVPSSERVEGELVSVFGPVTIDGEVTRDVTVVMAPLRLGDDAVLHGDVTVVGGPLTRAPGASIRGRLEEVAFSPFHGGWMPHPVGPGLWFPGHAGPFGFGFGSFGGTLTRVVLLVLLGFVAIAAARAAVERVGDQAAAGPVRAGLVGLLAELLFIPALVAIVVLLAVSIVGIPLLLLVPFAIAGVLLCMFVGFVAVAQHAGTRIARRFGWDASAAYLPLAVGVAAVASVTLLARLASALAGDFLGAPFLLLGYTIEFVAWTVGFGAVILAWFERRRVVTPRPEPLAPAAP
jgi:hypothetical protein